MGTITLTPSKKPPRRHERQGILRTGQAGQLVYFGTRSIARHQSILLVLINVLVVLGALGGLAVNVALVVFVNGYRRLRLTELLRVAEGGVFREMF